MKYIMARPKRVPKATGNNNSGMVFQLRKQMKMNISTTINDPTMVLRRSALVCQLL